MEPKYTKSLHVFPAVTFYLADDVGWYFDTEDSDAETPAIGPYNTMEAAAKAALVWLKTDI